MRRKRKIQNECFEFQSEKVQVKLMQYNINILNNDTVTSMFFLRIALH